jgi:hypothetical protein
MDRIEPDAEHYVREAERCSELGASTPNARTARRWRALADQYIVLAEAIAVRTRRRLGVRQAAQISPGEPDCRV